MAPDTDQRQAIEHGAGPLLVVAGPGTGKTFVITRRVVHLVGKQGVKPENILCLTFTEKAAEEMRGRIEAALSEAGVAGTPTAMTFHAFCQETLRQFPLESDLPRGARVIEGPRLMRFIMKRIEAFNLKQFRIKRSAIEFAQELEAFASRCHDEMMTPADALARAAAFGEKAKSAGEREAAALYEEFAECVRILAEELEDRRFLTFGDLITRTVRMLEGHPKARESLQARYTHLLVDEFQDDNFAQGKLVGLLAEPHGRVTVVGDDDQSIYRFRGAHPGILHDFELQWKPRGLQKVVLRQSYRSTPSIVAASSRLIRKSPGHDPEKILRPSEGAEGPHVRLVRTPDEERQAQYVADRARRAADGGTPLQSIAVLLRSMGHSEPIVQALRAAGLPIEVVGAGGLFDRREVRDLLSWAAFVTNPLRDDLAAYAVLWCPEMGIDPIDVARITRAAGDARKPVFEFVKDPARVPDLSTEAKAKLVDLTRRLDGYQPEVRQLPAQQALSSLVRFSAIVQRLDPEQAEGRRAAQNLDTLIRLAQQVADDTDQPGLEEFVELCDLIARSGVDLPASEPDLSDASVKVMTIHQAKGKEFELVVVPDLIERRFPPSAQPSPLEDFFVGVHHEETPAAAREDEERRLLYVAMTRAIHALELVTFQSYRANRHAYPSAFLADLGYEDEAPNGPVGDGCEVAEFAGHGRPAPNPPALPRRATLDELIRSALSILRAPPAESTEEARRLVAGLVGHLAAAQEEAGNSKALRQLAQELEKALGPIPMPLPRERAPVHKARPGIVQGTLEVSYSQLNTYERCPRQYMYGSVLNLRGRQSRQALAGNVIHQVLEEFLKTFGHAKKASLDDLIALYDSHFERSEFDTALERRQHYDDGLEMVKSFYEQEVKRDTQPVEFEKWFEFSLDDVKVRGRIDRIDKHGDGRFEVIDYKTGRVESRKAYATENLQLPIYAMAMDEGLHMKLKCATIYSLKDGKRITLNLGQDLTPEAIASARRKILGIAKDIRAGRFDPIPDDNKCPWCEFRSLCPASLARD